MKIDQIKKICIHLSTAIKKKKLTVKIPCSNFSNIKQWLDILKILQKWQIINGFTFSSNKDELERKKKQIISKTNKTNKRNLKEISSTIIIFLSYSGTHKPVLREIFAPTKQTQRIIMTNKKIKQWVKFYPYATAVLRTNLGLFDIQACNYQGIGGEVLFFII